MLIGDLEKVRIMSSKVDVNVTSRGIICFATWLFEIFDVLHSPSETKRKKLCVISINAALFGNTKSMDAKKSIID